MVGKPTWQSLHVQRERVLPEFATLGLYDMRNRVYDPFMGRFYQTDPIGFEGDPLNLYRFCGNNPLLGGDPVGLDEDDSDFTFTLDLGGPGTVFNGSSDAGIWASQNWWGDPVETSSISWPIYSDTLALSQPLFGGKFGMSQGSRRPCKHISRHTMECDELANSEQHSPTSAGENVLGQRRQCIPSRKLFQRCPDGWSICSPTNFYLPSRLVRLQLLKQAFTNAAANSIEREITLQQGRYINRVWDSRWTEGSVYIRSARRWFSAGRRPARSTRLSPLTEED